MAPRITTKDFKPHPALDHPPEVQALFHLVDLFANEMKIRLLEKYHKGKRGWDSESIRDILKRKLRKASIKGLFIREPVDIANLAMFLWNLR